MLIGEVTYNTVEDPPPAGTAAGVATLSDIDDSDVCNDVCNDAVNDCASVEAFDDIMARRCNMACMTAAIPEVNPFTSP